MLSLTGYLGFARLVARFENLPEAAEIEVRARVVTATELVYRQARENIADLFRNPAKMQNALQQVVTQVGVNSFEGRVSIEGAGYAALERGSGPHWIFPIHARALAFEPESAGGAVFAADVLHPGTRAYHFLRSAIADKREEIRASFAEVGRASWERTG